MTKTVPDVVNDFIDHYFNLKIEGKKVICPYYINKGGLLKSPVFSGKASPETIETETEALIEKISPIIKSAEDIREFMQQHDLGIDCSGFIYQIIDFWVQNSSKDKSKSLQDYLPKSSIINPRKFLSRKLKPESSVSADMLTSEPISCSIELSEIKPGDMIRSRGGKHILFIHTVEYDNQVPSLIYFVHSASEYKRSGVRNGVIRLNESLKLESSEWDDNDPNEEVNHAYKGYRELINKNGIFRINIPLT